MKNDEFVETSAESKRKLLALIIAGVAIALLQRVLFAHVRQLPFCSQAHWSWGLLAGCLAMLPIVGLFTGRYALKLLHYGQYPLPGAWVWKRTPITRGRAVRFRAYGLLLGTVAFFAIFLYGWHVLAPMVATISARCAT
jgi:hypothetical protein